jgi:hypothetical protein
VFPVVEICVGEGLVIHYGSAWLDGPTLSSLGGLPGFSDQHLESSRPGT